MLSFPPAVRIWLALAPADLRKGFDALAELVRQHLRDDPLSGHVFVFRNRRGDRIKLLYWDSDGYIIVYKRLEAGVFRFPAAVEGQVMNDNYTSRPATTKIPDPLRRFVLSSDN